MQHFAVVWSVTFMASLVWLLSQEQVKFVLSQVLSRITLSIIFQNVVILGIIITLTRWLTRRVPQLSYSLFTTGLKQSLMPVKMKYVGPVFLVLLIPCVPVITFFEEFFFRNNVKSLKGAVLWSIAFGLMHFLTMGTTVAISLGSTLMGGWLAWQYSQGGLTHSTVHHSTYDYCVLFLVIVGMIRSRLVAARQT